MVSALQAERSQAEPFVAFVCRAARRSSSHPAACVNFSETSRRKIAVCFSVSGATSSSTNFLSRVNPSSKSRRISSNLSIFLRTRWLEAQFRYYRNARCAPQGSSGSVCISLLGTQVAVFQTDPFVARRLGGISLSLANAPRALEKIAARPCGRRRRGASPEALSRVRLARRHQRHPLPRMRHEPALLSRRHHQENSRRIEPRIAGLDRLSRFEFFALRRPVDVHHPGRCRRRLEYSLAPRRNFFLPPRRMFR